MKVKDAVLKAILYTKDIFESENISNLGLEEVVFDDSKNEWVVTIGFSRPWDYPASEMFPGLNQPGNPRRSFKIVRINDVSGEVVAVKNRLVGDQLAAENY